MTLSSDALTTIVACEEALGITAGAEDSYLTRLIEVASSRIKRYCNRTFQFGDEIEEYVSGRGGVHLTVSRRPIVAITTVEYADEEVDSDNYKCVGYDDLENAGKILATAGWNWNTARVYNIAQDIYPGAEDPLYLITYDGGWVTPEQGRTGSVTAVADVGDGTIKLTSTFHRLEVGDSVTHTGFADSAYNGVFTVVADVDDDNYTVTATYTATGTGTFTKNGYTRNLPYDLEQACIDLVVLKYSTKGKNPNIKSERLTTWAATYGGFDSSASDDPFADIPSSIKGVLNAYRTMVIA
jgi:hypothetical protein